MNSLTSARAKVLAEDLRGIVAEVRDLAGSVSPGAWIGLRAVANRTLQSAEDAAALADDLERICRTVDSTMRPGKHRKPLFSSGVSAARGRPGGSCIESCESWLAARVGWNGAHGVSPKIRLRSRELHRLTCNLAKPSHGAVVGRWRARPDEQPHKGEVHMPTIDGICAGLMCAWKQSRWPEEFAGCSLVLSFRTAEGEPQSVTIMAGEVTPETIQHAIEQLQRDYAKHAPASTPPGLIN